MKFAAATDRNAPTRRVTRVVAAFGLAVVGLLFGGCSTISVERDLDTIVMMAPAPVLVKKGQELIAAEAAAKRIEGAQAFRGVGESMEPLYVSGTAIVTTPMEYSQLRAGMSVVYVNRSGRGVAHVLVNEMPGGWIAQGVNNTREDSDLVTRDNLVGVITQAYASTDTAMRRDLASRATMKAFKAIGPQLALNLPNSGNSRMVVAYQEGTN